MSTTSVDICKEIQEFITNPAQYIQEKVRNEDACSPLLLDCCTDLWWLNPACYNWRNVLEVAEWIEEISRIECEPKNLSLEDAFKEFLKNLVNPLPGFTIIPTDLSAIFKGYILAAYVAGSPIPNNIKNELKYLTSLNNYSFANKEIDAVRYLESDHPLAKVLWPGGDWSAITYYQLIIVDPQLLQRKLCRQTALWAHELTHVHQYVVLGIDEFVVRYLTEGMFGYDNISFEEEARGVQRRAYFDCLSRRNTAGARSFLAQVRMREYSLKNLLTKYHNKKYLKFKNGEIEWISEKGFEKLKRVYPKIVNEKPKRFLCCKKKGVS